MKDLVKKYKKKLFSAKKRYKKKQKQKLKPTKLKTHQKKQRCCCKLLDVLSFWICRLAVVTSFCTTHTHYKTREHG